MLRQERAEAVDLSSMPFWCSDCEDERRKLAAEPRQKTTTVCLLAVRAANTGDARRSRSTGRFLEGSDMLEF